MSTKNKYVKVKGKLFHPSLRETNSMSGKYQVNLCCVSKADKKKLEELGLTLKEGKDKVDASGNPKPEPDWGSFLVPKGNNPPRMVDAMMDAWPEDKQIGNGTEAYVVINAYDWTYQGKSGISPGLNYIQILSHVEYEGAGNLLEPEPDYADQ